MWKGDVGRAVDFNQVPGLAGLMSPIGSRALVPLSLSTSDEKLLWVPGH